MTVKLNDKICLVTGAGSGIGRASAMALAAEGGVVTVADINIEAAEAVAAEIRDAGGKADAAFIDICSEVAIAAAIEGTATRHGKLDVIHNNAAYATPEAIAADTDILSIPNDIWDSVMQGSLRGTMLCCRHAILAMRKSGGGSIINTSSMYGVDAFNRMPAYGVSKAGINMLTRQVATAFGREGVRCNAVAPSMIYTPMLAGAIPAEFIEMNVDATLTGFLGEPRDVANAVVWLASPDSRYITGQIIKVDGGSTAHLATYDAARRFFDGEPRK
jgi:NAD(P)-dependent dehydrogenase (short-subunit alcohol dehydrogenase family)